MVERTEQPDARWAAADAYIAGRLLGDQPALTDALTHNTASGLPDIAARRQARANSMPE